MTKEQEIIDALNAHGADLLNINCVLSGLAHQLSATQGPEGIEAARQYALKIAEAIPKSGPVRPNPKMISDFFNGHK